MICESAEISAAQWGFPPLPKGAPHSERAFSWSPNVQPAPGRYEDGAVTVARSSTRRIADWLRHLRNGWQVGARSHRPAIGHRIVPSTVREDAALRGLRRVRRGVNGIGSISSVKPSLILSSLPSAHPCDPNQSFLLGQIVSWHGSERPLGMKTADPISADIAPASACGLSSGDA